MFFLPLLFLKQKADEKNTLYFFTFQGTYSQIWFNDTAGYMIRFGANVSIPSKSHRDKTKILKEKQ